MSGAVVEPEVDYPPSCYAATAPRLAPFPALAGERRCDVAVIGGGYTGLSAALHLAAAGFETVLVEARRVGWGASGRNGGQLHSGQRRDQDWLEATVGRGDARALWDLGEAAKALIVDLVAWHAIDCDLARGLLHADHKARYVARSRRYAEKLARDYGYAEAGFVDRDGVRALVDSAAYHGGWLDRGGLHLDPFKLALGLAGAAMATGATIHEATPALRIMPGEPARIETPAGRLAARFVLLACNGYMDGLNAAVERHVMPITSYMIATAPLAERRARGLIAGGIAVTDSRFVTNYFRLSPERRLLFGGGEAYGGRGPVDVRAFVRRHMLRVFPQLADVAIDFGWGGRLAVTMNRMPFVRRIGPNMLAAAGYSGHGVGMATMAGRIMAEVVGGTLARFDLLARLPVRAFPGGRALRRPLLALAMSWYALRDRF